VFRIVQLLLFTSETFARCQAHVNVVCICRLCHFDLDPAKSFGNSKCGDNQVNVWVGKQGVLSSVLAAKAAAASIAAPAMNFGTLVISDRIAKPAHSLKTATTLNPRGTSWLMRRGCLAARLAPARRAFGRKEA
jgi:hypothetical protein